MESVPKTFTQSYANFVDTVVAEKVESQSFHTLRLFWNDAIDSACLAAQAAGASEEVIKAIKELR